jgi:NADPH:quinone reductase-like Zn-dependent oxidoreductase
MVRIGFLQEWVVIADERVIRAPGHLTAVENSALVTAGVTAWSAIREGLDMVLTGEMREWRDGKRLEGKTILTQGTGGVSCFAIQVRRPYGCCRSSCTTLLTSQIAAALGATVIVTSSSDEKLALAKELGATHGINYKTHPDWDVEVKRLTNGAGVDHVIELGGAQTLMKSVASVRVGGLISVIGILSAPQDIPGQIIPALLFGGITGKYLQYMDTTRANAQTVKGCVAFSRDATADFAKFVEQHGIKPVVAKVFEYQDATAAFEAMQKQTEVGKIVIKVSDE